MADKLESQTSPLSDPTGSIRTACLLILCALAVSFTLYLGRELFVPIGFAVLLNVLLRPVVRWMRRAHVPAAVASALIVLAIFGAAFGAGYVLAGPAQKWAAALPERMAAARSRIDKLRQPVQQAAAVADQLQNASSGPTSGPAHGASSQPITPPAPAPPGTTWVARVVGTTTTILSETVEALLLLYLLLAADDLFYQKLLRVLRLRRDRTDAARAVGEVESAVVRYVWVTLLINIGQGAIVGVVLWWIGMPGPLLWAIATVVLEFIPYLGATVMIALISITALATFDDAGRVLAAPGSYLLITTIQNNVVSPIAYGSRLRLNPVAVLVGVLFWWFVWGTPGAFLAVPIVATVKIVADHSERFKPVGEFLGE